MADADVPPRRVRLSDLPAEVLALIIDAALPASFSIYNASLSQTRSFNETTSLYHYPGLVVRLQGAEHPGTAIVARHKTASMQLRAVCSRFRDASRASVKLVNSHGSHRILANTPTDSNHWFPEDVVLQPSDDDRTRTVFAYEVRADYNPQTRHNPAGVTEVIGAFSHSRARFEAEGADALTWYGATNRDDFTFRTRMFEPLPVLPVNGWRLLQDTWYLVVVRLSSGSCSYEIGGLKFAETSRQPGQFGMVTYTTSYSWRNAVIFSEAQAPSAHEVEEEERRRDMMTMMQGDY